jgi:serpin B
VPQLELSMPRFRLEYEALLNQPLQTLGMPTAFTDFADFTAMSRGGGLYIAFVRQKTYVDVNEEGTEAAAVTVVGMGTVSMPQAVTFVVDRPFLMAIREQFSGSILFLGAIGAP